ncbi:MAG: sulfotransferase domain-containing protein [Gammaproteobacteria bacterium]|nr:sulfotransferase domain-containing protein [Gammaproteobacteria bacterium]
MNHCTDRNPYARPLLNTFDAIFCINLDHRPDRWEHALSQFNALGVGHKLERVPGIVLSKPALGCCFSHIKCVELAIERGLESILIFEDDVLFDFSLPPEILERAVSELTVRSDWELFYLGGRRVSRGKKVANNLYATRLFSSHAYAINARAFRKILTATPAIDVWYSKNCQSYCVYPMFATQMESYSDVRKTMVDWKTSDFLTSYKVQTSAIRSLAATCSELSRGYIRQRVVDRVRTLRSAFDGRVRKRTVLNDDTYIVSYPKSGNTWLRYMLAQAVSGRLLLSLSELNNVIPDMYQYTDEELLQCQRPRIIKSHERCNRKYRKVVYIVRDPRSVMISLFHYQKKLLMLPEELSLEAFMERFISGAGLGHGKWSDHVNGWLARNNNASTFRLVKYEDICTDPIGQLCSICNWLGLRVDEEMQKEIVEGSSLEALRKREKDEKWQSTLKVEDTSRNFFRKGEPEEWKTVLKTEAKQRMATHFAPELRRLGYSEGEA